MPIKIDSGLTPERLLPKLHRLFELSARKLHSLETSWNPAKGTPVFTIRGRYTSRTWTEWTQGFQFGSALLQFDATAEKRWLELGRTRTFQHMATHVSHIGVHDHGFNNISTYGQLLRLVREGKVTESFEEAAACELALKVSGAIQAARWSKTREGGGYIYSFNGPHSLFIDTMRSLRSLAVAHRLGHVLLAENDERVCLLGRLLQHALTTAGYAIYYGEGRDVFDVPGRTAQESIFNINDGRYRCPSTQQGFSPFSTWTRGLGWAVLGFAEELEFLQTVQASAIRDALAPTPSWRPNACIQALERAALATADFALENSCADGVPMWDTRAPQLVSLGDYLHRPSDPFNRFEPVDSSAAAILGQGLLRLGSYLMAKGRRQVGMRYRQAGLTIADTLFQEPYLSTHPKHQGLILHSVYHRPNGWDYVAPGQAIPNGESSLWGDYHARELALLILREGRGDKPLCFFAV